MAYNDDDNHSLGKEGEDSIYYQIRQRFPENHIFRNIYLTKANGKLSEIDLIAVCTNGIVVFESKNFSGWIFGNASQKTGHKVLETANLDFTILLRKMKTTLNA